MYIVLPLKVKYIGKPDNCCNKYRLLFYHGRVTYIRMSFMIVFFFFKNMLFTLPQFYFSFLNQFSRFSLYNEWLISFFNLLTTFSLILYALFEVDMRSRSEENYSPDIYLYFYGQKNYNFNQTAFLGWVVIGFLESLFIFIVTCLVNDYSTNAADFHSSHFELVSTQIFVTVVLHIQVKIFLYIKNMTAIMFIGNLITGFGMLIAYILLVDPIWGFSYYRTLRIIWTNPNNYLIIFFLVGTLFIVNFFFIQLRYSLSIDLAIIYKYIYTYSSIFLDSG